MIKAIIFDWGRTLYDSEQGSFFSAVPALLAELSQRYTLAIVSLVSGDYALRANERRAALSDANLSAHFAAIQFVPTDKDRAYQETLMRLKVSAIEMAIVDDRVKRGIAWGNQHGATTIWLKRGRFSGALPNAITGMPTYTINAIEEVGTLLKRHEKRHEQHS